MKRFIIVILLLVFTFYNFSPILAATSPWSQTDWSTNNFSASSNTVTSTPNQVTITNNEKLTNTGFETDLTSWTATPVTFHDSSFLTASSSVAAWPLDDTTSTQSYSRVLNPAVATGRNIVINGTFDTDTVWTKGTGWTIAAGTGVATAALAGTSISQSILTTGKVYTVTFDITVVSGSARIGGGAAGTVRSATGTYSETLLFTSSTFNIQAVSTFTGTIDNVIVTQLSIPASSATSATQLLTDGDMEAVGTAAWGTGGNAVISKDSSSPHGGTQSLKVAYNGTAGAFAKQTGTTAAGTAYRVTGYMRGDGTAIPNVALAGGTAVVTGTSSTTWQPFDFVAVNDGSTFIFRNGTSSGFVNFDDVTVSLDNYIRPGEISVDGGLETWTNSTTLTNWNKSTAGTSTVNQETNPANVHSGTSAVRLDVDSSNSSVNINQSGIIVLGKTYHVTFWAKASSNGPQISTDIISGFSPALTTSYAQYEFTGVALTAPFDLKRSTGAASSSIYIDDISVTEIDPLSGLPTNGVAFPTTSGGHLTNAYSFDGTNDLVNIYSSDLNSAFNPSEGTLVAWAKVSGAGVWTDGTQRMIVNLQVDGSNAIRISKTTVNNVVQFLYFSTGSTLSTTTTGLGGSTGWMQIAITWSKSGDQVKAYANGAQVNSTLTGLGTWTGNLVSTLNMIGALDTAGDNPWSGLINDVQLYSSALSAAQISALYSGITATRDTSIKHTGTASSKLVSTAGYTGSFTESVNVGDTNSYNLVAYTYIDGSTVTDGTYAQLYYNGTGVTTTYTSVGSGWTKLTGTVTGVASSVGAGMEVFGGKTVYVDDMSLNNYASPGTLTSSVFDSGQGSNWGILTYSATTPTNTGATVKVRTGNQSDLSDATAFSSCNAIASGATVGGTNCANLGTRYAQYQVTLSSSDLLNTPTFTSFSLPFTTSFFVNLDSPGNNSYTNNQRPTFKWEKTNVSGGVSKYIIEIDSANQTPIIVDNIPPDRSSDLITSKYVIHYDSTSISFYTTSSSSWGSSENDGKLPDGTTIWKVTAVDSAGNRVSATRTLYVDTTPPTLTNVSVSGTSLPTISGSTSDTFSGVESVDVKIEKEDLFGNWNLYLDATIHPSGTSFSFTPDSPLPNGTYKITVAAKDNAGNLSNPVILSLNVSSGKIIVAPTPTPSSAPRVTATATPIASTAPTSAPQGQTFSFPKISLPQITLPKISLNINFGEIFGTLFKQYVNLALNLSNFNTSIATNIFSTYENYSNFVISQNNNMLAFIGNTLNTVGSGIGNSYNNLANRSFDGLRTVLLAISNVVSRTTAGINNFLANIQQAGRNAAYAINLTMRNIGYGISNFMAMIRNGAANLAFNIGERARNISSGVGQAIVSVGYSLVDGPTTIQNVKVTTISSTSVKISWQTNQLATGKVNYGLDETYTKDVQSTELTKDHEFTITGLDPNTRYAFEVMSQGKNYVYDANRFFKTPGN